LLNATIAASDHCDVREVGVAAGSNFSLAEAPLRGARDTVVYVGTPGAVRQVSPPAEASTLVAVNVGDVVGGAAARHGDYGRWS